MTMQQSACGQCLIKSCMPCVNNGMRPSHLPSPCCYSPAACYTCCCRCWRSMSPDCSCSWSRRTACSLLASWLSYWACWVLHACSSSATCEEQQPGLRKMQLQPVHSCPLRMTGASEIVSWHNTQEACEGQAVCQGLLVLVRSCLCSTTALPCPPSVRWWCGSPARYETTRPGCDSLQRMS